MQGIPGRLRCEISPPIPASARQKVINGYAGSTPERDQLQPSQPDRLLSPDPRGVVVTDLKP